MYLSGNDYEVALYYLFMLSDNKLTDDEMKLFKSICFRLDKEDSYENIIDYCDSLGRASSFTKLENEKIAEKLASYYDDSKSIDSKYSKGRLIEIIWNLIELGKSDCDYSEYEEHMILYLCDSWNISESIYKELLDCSRTIDSIELYREWVRETYSSSQGLFEEEKNIDNQLNLIQNMVSNSAKEFAINA